MLRLCVMASAAAAASATSRGGCGKFFDRLAAEHPECVEQVSGERFARCGETEDKISAAKCIAAVARLRGDSSEDADCLGLHPYDVLYPRENRIFEPVPGGCAATVSANVSTDELKMPWGSVERGTMLEAKEKWRPTSVETVFKCPFAPDVYEMELPCLQPGEKVYYEAVINKVRGFEFSLRTEDGSPLGLMPLYRLGDVEENDVFDCFAADTTDDSSCYDSRIAKGMTLPQPFTFEFEGGVKVRLGFKACNLPALTGCGTKRILTFRTTGFSAAGVYKISGCIGNVVKATPTADTICNDNGAGRTAASFLLLAAVLLTLLL